MNFIELFWRETEDKYLPAGDPTISLEEPGERKESIYVLLMISSHSFQEWFCSWTPQHHFERGNLQKQGSIVIPSVHFCERTRAEPRFFTYKIIIQINAFSREEKKYLNHPQEAFLSGIFWKMLHTW